MRVQRVFGWSFGSGGEVRVDEDVDVMDAVSVLKVASSWAREKEERGVVAVEEGVVYVILNTGVVVSGIGGGRWWWWWCAMQSEHVERS